MTYKTFKLCFLDFRELIAPATARLPRLQPPPVPAVVFKPPGMLAGWT
jgi:hypothetical protein